MSTAARSVHDWETFGMVRRARCVCGDVIVVAANARPGLVEAALVRHSYTAAHRSYYGLDAPIYDQNSETPPTAPVPGSRRTGLTSRGAVSVLEERSLVPDSRGGVFIRPDGYDFDVPPPPMPRDRRAP